MSFFTDYMKNNMTRIYKPVKKLICDQTDKKIYLCCYANLNVGDRLGMESTELKGVMRFKKKTTENFYR